MNPIESLHETMRLQFSERTPLNKIRASAMRQTLTPIYLTTAGQVMPALQKGLNNGRR